MSKQMELPHNGTPTSRAAAEAKRDAASDEARVLLWLYEVRIGGFSGATDEEMQKGMGMRGDTQRPRRVKLVERGHVARAVEHDGKPYTVKTTSGRQAQVWTITGEGVARVLAEVITGAWDERAKS